VIGALALPHEYPADAWDRTIAISLTGVWLCFKHEVQHMLDHGGAIVNTSSVMGLVAGPTNVAYAANKHGVIGLTKSAALA
jgi:NAD(P)-dependent dehydrogenase (short-subunit alcohol dehydrogenase family)